VGIRGIFFLFIFFVNFLFSNLKDLDLNAKNAILINAKNNKILFEKNSSELAYPASITKVASILYILNNYEDKLSMYYTPSKDALKVISPDKKFGNLKNYSPYVLESDGTMFDIVEGERLKLENMLFGMMVVSGNDASNAAAEMLEGSIDKFVNNLNLFLKDIGCKNTNFLNPHGLHHPDHKTSAFDLALILSKAYQNEKFMQLFSCNYFIREESNKQKSKELKTHNRLLKPNKFRYKYVLGAKTGYHTKAKYNLSAIAKKGDRELIGVVLGCKLSDQRYEDMINLFNEAFKEEKESIKIVDKSLNLNAKLDGASKIIKGYLKDDLILSYYPSELTDYKTYIYWNDVSLPILKDTKLGFIKIVDENEDVLEKLPIYAKENVRRSFFRFLKDLF
jgi:D-alanyl-D-alanine carboxypeptidase (penicillin-binding protein 5/6)